MYNEKETKVWGETRKIFRCNNTEMHILKAKKGGYCSKHYHEHKINYFYVDSGKLLIEVWRENNLIDKTILKSDVAITKEFSDGLILQSKINISSASRVF